MESAISFEKEALIEKENIKNKKLSKINLESK